LRIGGATQKKRGGPDPHYAVVGILRIARKPASGGGGPRKNPQHKKKNHAPWG